MTQIAQNSRRIRPALRAIAFAVSRFRLPIPTIRERATEGRIVICQILMNASLERFHDRAEVPKDQPGDNPEDEPQQYPCSKAHAGQSHYVSLPARGHRCTAGRDRRFPARQQIMGRQRYRHHAPVTISGVGSGPGFRCNRILPSALFNRCRGRMPSG